MIGKWLKEKRENLSLTAQDIKQETKTSSTLISLVETGKRLPSEKFLESYLLVLAKLVVLTRLYGIAIPQLSVLRNGKVNLPLNIKAKILYITVVVEKFV